jgi:hypothetical protein
LSPGFEEAKMPYHLGKVRAAVIGNVSLFLLFSFLSIIVLSSPAAAQTSWSWQGHVPTGLTLEVAGINGDIRATPAHGPEVRVTAEKVARGGEPEGVRIEVVQHGNGVTICAVYPTPEGRSENTCRPGGGGQSVQNNPVQVVFQVEVPPGVNFTARTVQGDIDASDLESNIAVHTVNGAIRASTTGTATARTVNGAIDVAMGGSYLAEPVSYETVNGDITLRFAGELHARLRATTLNGSIRSDYPMTVHGTVSRRNIDAVLGAGGPDLQMKTVNGTIEIRRY